MTPVGEERYHLAYVFERFPTFTQTFCVREVMEMMRQGVRPLIFSLRDTRDEPVQNYPEELRQQVVYLPSGNQLTEFVRDLRTRKLISRPVDHTLRFWRDQPDKKRVYEAAWIGHYLKTVAPGVHHTHGHFAGMAARTMWWLRNFYGHTYSFTAHANDVFVDDQETEVRLPMLMRDASRIVTVSDYTVRRLGREYPFAAHKIRRVYNGLDLEKWVEARRGEPRGIGSRRIYSVGRLIEKKGFDDLIRACGYLRDRKVAFTCHIIGGGPLEAELTALIEKLDLKESVFLEGEKDQDGIIDHFSNRAHVFALPCVVEKDGGMDNLPTVLMEAMAAGLPCVSTRLAGVPEMVIDGETGLLTNERQPESFSHALEMLLKDEAKSRAYGEAGFDLCAERFDKRQTVKELKRALISGGLVRIDPKLVSAQPDLGTAYAWQLALRTGRRLRFWNTFNPQEMLAPPEEEEEKPAETK